MAKKKAKKATVRRNSQAVKDLATAGGAQTLENAGATMDGPSLPPGANLTKPPGSTECIACGFVFAGRTNCSNCGHEMSDAQIAEINEYRKAAGIAPYRR